MSSRTYPSSSSRKSQEQANPPREIPPFLQDPPPPRQRSPASPPQPTISYKPHKPTKATDSFTLEVEFELAGDLAAMDIMDIHVWKNKTRIDESDITKQFRPPPPNAPAPKKLKWIVGPLQCPVGVTELKIDAVQKTDRQVSEHTGNVERTLPELYSEHVWTETITISE